MDLIDRAKVIAEQVKKLKDQIRNEEATKTAFIMPFLQALGYDVFNPLEVHPEYTADLPGLKGEKVDYAICVDNRPIVLIECKTCTENLTNAKHSSQLHRYFHATEARLAILTNGIIYRFYTDTDKNNVMDDKPFFEFDILNFDENSVNELKRFTKSQFNINELEDVARNLLYTREVKRVIAEQLSNPSPDLVKLLISEIYSGTKTASVIERFTEITKKSLREYINEKIKEKLETVINSENTLDTNLATAIDVNVQDSNTTANDSSQETSERVTTEEELQAFYLIKSILREQVDTSRIQYKNTQKYFGINLDGKVRQTICRLRFSEESGKKSLEIPDNNDSKKRVKTLLENLDQIYGVAEFLKARVQFLTKYNYTAQPEESEVV
ncbi:MAG: restriction endonuclease [Gloeocapsa sp. DLM2.Bin57]|nr:MAG: restriction endonuclease [Gloeocapsa sp. DLM2.Bin57]